jgi:hypothetical protein
MNLSYQFLHKKSKSSQKRGSWKMSDTKQTAGCKEKQLRDRNNKGLPHPRQAFEHVEKPYVAGGNWPPAT